MTEINKQVGYIKLNNGREFVMRESHRANLRERVYMYRLLIRVAKEAENDDRPNWLRLRWLMWTHFLKPSTKACYYEEVTPGVFS